MQCKDYTLKAVVKLEGETDIECLCKEEPQIIIELLILKWMWRK